jgi:hypothetical protein
VRQTLRHPRRLSATSSRWPKGVLTLLDRYHRLFESMIPRLETESGFRSHLIGVGNW